MALKQQGEEERGPELLALPGSQVTPDPLQKVKRLFRSPGGISPTEVIAIFLEELFTWSTLLGAAPNPVLASKDRR